MKTLTRIPEHKRKTIKNLDRSGIAIEIISLELDLDEGQVLAFLEETRARKLGHEMLAA